eukprot:COSAG03_NODE_40_length_17307_cov_3.149457_13_plen_618_part_00
MLGIHTASGQPRRRSSIPGLRLQPLLRPSALQPPPSSARGDHNRVARTPSPPTLPASASYSGRRATRARRYQRRVGSPGHVLREVPDIAAGDDDDDEHSCICGLDYEILSCIAGHMDATSLLALSSTRRRFMQLRDDRLVWYRIYTSSFGEDTVGCGHPRDDLDGLRSIDWALRYRERATVYSAQRILADEGPLGGEASDLLRGKYTSWSHGSAVARNALPACLCAIGELGLHYPLPTHEVSGGPHLHPHQVAALSFLRSVFDEASWTASDDAPPPLELTTEQWLQQLADTLGATTLDFEARTKWTGGPLSTSDIFGILWHIGGFAVRGWSFGRPASHLSDRARSITPDGRGGLGLDFGALVVSTHTAARQSDASIPAIQQINPRQLMAILHLMKLGAGESTYYQLAGVRKPLPEGRWGHLDEAHFPDIEEEAAALRSTDRSSPFAPPSCPRPSSGGITDSFGRPFEGLWGPDDEPEEASSACDGGEAVTHGPVAPRPSPMMTEPEGQAAQLSLPGLSHLSLRMPEQLQAEGDDDSFLEPPPPPGGQRRRSRVAESVAESVRESFHFDHFADDEEGDVAAGSCGDGVSEEEEEEQWSLEAPPSVSDRRGREATPGGA